MVPVDQLLVETDAPFLTPMPYRGRPNAPYLVPLTVRALAEVKTVHIEHLCEHSHSNGAAGLRRLVTDPLRRVTNLVLTGHGTLWSRDQWTGTVARAVATATALPPAGRHRGRQLHSGSPSIVPSAVDSRRPDAPRGPASRRLPMDGARAVRARADWFATATPRRPASAGPATWPTARPRGPARLSRSGRRGRCAGRRRRGVDRWPVRRPSRPGVRGPVARPSRVGTRGPVRRPSRLAVRGPVARLSRVGTVAPPPGRAGAGAVARRGRAGG